jgi:hypothetical protein
MVPPPRPSEPGRRRLIDGPRLFAGIIVGALAAGPLFFLAGTFAAPLIPSLGGEAFRWTEGQALPLILIEAIRGAFLSALLPMSLGAAMMGVLGVLFRRARSWLAWLAAGLAEAGLICLLFFSGFPLLMAALFVTGLGCAAICRAFARWPDEGADASA